MLYYWQLLGEPGSGGSSTPSMVGSVRQWQKSDPKSSLEIWTRLADANAKLEAQLNLLNKYAREQWVIYKHIMGSCSSSAHLKVAPYSYIASNLLYF